MLFKYSGIDSTGKNITSKIEANSLEDAKLKLKYKKIIYTKIEEDRQNIFTRFFIKKQKIDALTLSYISRDLSLYLKSGITLVKSIRLMTQRYKDNRKLNSFFESVEAFLDEGKSFNNALERQTVIAIPDFYIQSIKVSEDGGLLETVLLELSVFLKEQERIKKDLAAAMTYPAFILAVSFLMVIFMLSVVVPQISQVFLQLDKSLPPITSFVIGVGDFFSHYYVYVFSSFIFVILSMQFMFKKIPLFKYYVHLFLLKIPFFGMIVQFNELSRFAYMSSILIKSGLPVVHAFKLSSDILKNSVLKVLFQKGSEKIVEGERLSIILERNSIYKIDKAFIHAVAIGEETSDLSFVLSNLAKLYTESSKDKSAFFLSLLEPILMLFIGLVIGFIILAMLLPIFTLNLG